MTLLEFTTFWELGDYGDATTAQDAHNALDFNQDGVIDSVDDIDQLYTNIDTDSMSYIYYISYIINASKFICIIGEHCRTPHTI